MTRSPRQRSSPRSGLVRGRRIAVARMHGPSWRQCCLRALVSASGIPRGQVVHVVNALFEWSTRSVPAARRCAGPPWPPGVRQVPRSLLRVLNDRNRRHVRVALRTVERLTAARLPSAYRLCVDVGMSAAAWCAVLTARRWSCTLAGRSSSARRVRRCCFPPDRSLGSRSRGCSSTGVSRACRLLQVC